MAEKTINARIQCKIDTAENWKTNNPVLLVGELGVESDTKLIKVGDGTTSWTSLPYLQYLPLSGGQLTGALRIAKGTGNGIQDYDGNPMLYIDNYDDLYIRNDSGTEIHLGTASGEHIQIGGHKVLSDTNVVGHSFTFNGEPVAITDDIPKTLNNKTLVANGNTTIYGTDITLASDNAGNVTDAINNTNTRIDNLTTTVNGKADISAIPTKTSQLTNDSNFATTSDLSAYLPLSGGQLTGELRINDKQVAVVDDIPTSLSQLSEDTTHRVVTDTEKATWNAKSNFDGDYNSLTNKPVIPTNADFTLAGLKEKSYNSLTDKPTIPTKTSQLTNDSNFATTSQIPDISGKANLSGGNTFSGTQKFNNSVSINADYGLEITDSNGVGLSINTLNNTPTILSNTGHLQFMKTVSNIWTIGIDTDGGLVFFKE